MTTRSEFESTYELEIIRPAPDTQNQTDLDPVKALGRLSSDNKPDTLAYLEREEVTEEGTSNVIEAEVPPPDGGYGWVIVGACYIITFFYIGSVYSFGVVLTRLKEDGLASSSTLSFAGGLTSAMISFLAIINSNIIKRFGSKAVLLVGVTILGLGEVLSGWTVNNIGGFFVTVGFVMGVGTSLIFMPCTLLPSQYFSRKRGLAIGIVYSAGGVGGAVLSLVLDALLTKYGPAWTFRILGFITWGACLPACLLIKERPGKRSAAFIEWSYFKELRYLTIFIAASLGVFPLFVPPFFLPLYGTSMGLSHSSSAGLAAGFNLASAVGRIAFGLLADRIGPINSLIIAFVTNAISLLLVWPLSGSVGPLIVFVILTGVAAGAFFSLMPSVVASIATPATLPSAMGMMVTGWGAGYLLGSPLAGFLLDAYGGTDKGLSAYRPAMFYAGALTVVSALLLVAMKWKTQSLKKRM